jgi:hypothetical protein
MALDGEQWLRTHFFPVVDSLPAPGDSDSAPPSKAVAAFAAIRLLGAVDALTEVGVLDEEQQGRCRAALEPKGVTRTKQFAVQSIGVLTATTQDSGGAAQQHEELPDSLVRVIGSGQLFGLIDDEQAVLLCTEVWRRTVRASFLLATSPVAEAERIDRHRELREWFAKKQAGEVDDGERPPMSAGMRHPGSGATWSLRTPEGVTEGRMASGSGGGEWWRVDIEWQVALPTECREVEISATEESRVVGRATVAW